MSGIQEEKLERIKPTVFLSPTIGSQTENDEGGYGEEVADEDHEKNSTFWDNVLCGGPRKRHERTLWRRASDRARTECHFFAAVSSPETQERAHALTRLYFRELQLSRAVHRNRRVESTAPIRTFVTI